MINNSLNITTKTIEEKIVTNTPFSHFYINKVFPEELFKLIHDNWPTVDLFENGLKAGHNLEAERFYFKLIEISFIYDFILCVNPSIFIKRLRCV